MLAWNPRPSKPYNRSHMHLRRTSQPACRGRHVPPCSRSMAEKPHQGVTGKNPGLHQGATACNSTTALGVSWRLWSGTVPGATVTYEYDAFGNKINSTAPRQTTTSIAANSATATWPLLPARQILQPHHGPVHVQGPGRRKPFDPKTLHKYLYAGGDPVNLKDPTGKDLVGDALARAWSTARTVIEGTRIRGIGTLFSEVHI